LRRPHCELPHHPILQLEVVTLTIDQVRELIGEAVAKALDNQRRCEEADAQCLSANAAAKLARSRRETVTLALEAGTLQGQRVGRRWLTTVAAERAWVEAGRPVEAS
jgi:hypothetical protein